MVPPRLRNLLVAFAIVVAGALLWAALAALRPLPERTLTMATGPDGSAYQVYAVRYRALLAQQGVTVRLVPTRGALDNLELLRDRHSGVSVAFIQAGTTTADQSPQLLSLGTVFYEPLWIFCRCETQGLQMTDLSDRHVSIGPDGSATRDLVLRLMRLNALDPATMQVEGYSPERAAEELEQGRIDVAIMDTAWDSPVVRRLLTDPAIGLRSVTRADAYIALMPFLSKLVLPMGVANLAENRPSSDVVMIAPKTSLVVRGDLHPALQYLLIDAAMRIHGAPGIFNRAGEFPAAEMMDLPLSDEANHMYRSGPNFLRRHLPFWLAEMVQRLLLLAIPLAGLVYPAGKLAPVVWRWAMERRVQRMYRELLALEREIRVATPGPGRDKLHERLDALEARALGLRLPDSFAAAGYELKQNIRFVQRRYRAQGTFPVSG